MNRDRKRRTKISARQRLAAGILANVPEGVTLVIHGEAYTREQVAARMEARADAEDAIVRAHAAWQAALQASEEEAKDGDDFEKALRATLLSMFGKAPEKLAELGVVPPKPRRKATTTDQLLTIEKSKATREVRHTMGLRQRLALTGKAAEANGTSP